MRIHEHKRLDPALAVIFSLLASGFLIAGKSLPNPLEGYRLAGADAQGRPCLETPSESGVLALEDGGEYLAGERAEACAKRLEPPAEGDVEIWVELETGAREKIELDGAGWGSRTYGRYPSERTPVRPVALVLETGWHQLTIFEFARGTVHAQVQVQVSESHVVTRSAAHYGDGDCTGDQHAAIAVLNSETGVGRIALSAYYVDNLDVRVDPFTASDVHGAGTLHHLALYYGTEEQVDVPSLEALWDLRRVYTNEPALAESLRGLSTAPVVEVGEDPMTLRQRPFVPAIE